MTKSVERGYVAAMARAVAAEQPDAIMIVCTNLNSAQWVDELERELKIPIYDSLSAVVWHALKLAGIDPAPIAGWGRLFQRKFFDEMCGACIFA
jgi:maleate isomerase